MSKSVLYKDKNTKTLKREYDSQTWFFTIEFISNSSSDNFVIIKKNKVKEICPISKFTKNKYKSDSSIWEIWNITLLWCACAWWFSHQHLILEKFDDDIDIVELSFWTQTKKRIKRWNKYYRSIEILLTAKQFRRLIVIIGSSCTLDEYIKSKSDEYLLDFWKKWVKAKSILTHLKKK